MPITLSYDITDVPDANTRSYIAAMLKRFNWRHLGGSVFRYSGTVVEGETYEDWFNHVVPALMFFRSYITAKNLKLKSFTIDTMSNSFMQGKSAKVGGVRYVDIEYGLPPLSTEDMLNEMTSSIGRPDVRKALDSFFTGASAPWVDASDDLLESDSDEDEESEAAPTQTKGKFNKSS